MAVYIGTSGWQYRHWRERFYPKTVPQKAWLEYYAERFMTVESNNAFYMLPKPETFESWAERTPKDFVMTVKVNRYITHIRRLRDCEESITRFMEHAHRLGDKLGPVLLQLPPNLKINLESLDDSLRALSATKARVAVEFRHDTWFVNEVRDLLSSYGAALCMADRGSRPISPLWRTTDWTYLRLHHGIASPIPCYGRGALRSWVERLNASWAPEEEMWVFFNNDPEGCALRDARIFARESERAGLEATRVPPETIPVG